MNHHSTPTTDDLRSNKNQAEPISYEDERFGALRILIWFLGGAPQRQRSAPAKVAKEQAPIFANEGHSIIHPAHVS